MIGRPDPRALALAWAVASLGAGLGGARAAAPAAPPPARLPRLVVTDLHAPGQRLEPEMAVFLAEQVRGVALRRLAGRFSVGPLLAVQPGLPPGARCVAACRAAAAARAGGEVAIVGALLPTAGGTSVRLQAYWLPARRVFAQAMRTGDDPVVAAVAAAEDLAGMLAQAPQGAVSPPPPPLPAQRAQAPPHGVGGPGPSPLAAFGLELLLPSAGLFYAGESGAGALVLLGLGAGAGTMVVGIDRRSDTLAIVGGSLLLVARLGGVVAAPVLAAGHRGQPRAAARALDPPPPPEALGAGLGGLASSPPPATWSWAGTF